MVVFFSIPFFIILVLILMAMGVAMSAFQFILQIYPFLVGIIYLLIFIFVFFTKMFESEEGAPPYTFSDRIALFSFSFVGIPAFVVFYRALEDVGELFMHTNILSAAINGPIGLIIYLVIGIVLTIVAGLVALLPECIFTPVKNDDRQRAKKRGAEVMKNTIVCAMRIAISVAYYFLLSALYGCFPLYAG